MKGSITVIFLFLSIALIAQESDSLAGTSPQFEQSGSHTHSSLDSTINNDISNQNYNTIFFEFFGVGGLGSLNYERHDILSSEMSALNLRAGIAINPFVLVDGPTLLIPLGLSLDFGKKKNNFQLSVNRTFDLTFDSEPWGFTSMGLGYVGRSTNGPYYNLSFLALILDQEVDYFLGTARFIPWIGIGVGYGF